MPYRIYEIGGNHYFEFFSLPYDQHRNPRAVKGVLFDTNRTYDENSIWEMFEKKRVSAYGGAQYFAEYLNPGDVVFYSHRYVGIVAAGRVIGPTKSDGPEEKYHDVEFLTPVPTRRVGVEQALSFRQVSQITGKSFYWARTVKVPYLSKDEADQLLEELRSILTDAA